MNITDFSKHKQDRKKISMVTAYDYTMAKIISQTNIDAVLIGDSASMVMHGYNSTTQIDVKTMALHTKAVAKAIKIKPIIADMPFLTFRKDLKTAMNCVETLIKSGANGVKIEGTKGHEDLIRHIINSGIPVMGHLGLTPQSINIFGGHKFQGKNEKSAKEILNQAKDLTDLGCFAIVLECIPAQLAKDITNKIKIPTIGIGAGPYCNGQILVLQDMLGMYKDITPKFVKKYMNGYETILNALNSFDEDIKKKRFPKK